MSSIINNTWFSQIRRPSRYLGNEINAIKKDPSSIEVAILLAFPDIYEVGMSHLGLKILYNILNACDWLAAERVFCPWVDLEMELKDRGIGLTSLESSRPLIDFDIIGFSLQHELSFTNVMNMLGLSGIPVLSKNRDSSFPLILAGGPACFNPEPVANLFDAIVIGDGEKAALEICKTVRRAKLRRLESKNTILHELTKIQGIYVPRFFKIHYRPDGAIDAVEPLKSQYRVVKKALIPDIDDFPFPGNQVVPFTELVHDRLAIEISRGCTRGCRFCQAGMIYRPVRERDPRSIIKNLEEALQSTGFEEISLLSLSSGDYSCIGPLLKELMDRHSGDKVAVSLPSLRVDSLDPFWFEQIKRVRKTGFTLAPEAGNDDLRKIINKSLTDDDIINMAQEVYRAGWNLIKLYFMIGLPGEDEKGIHDIIQLSRSVCNLAKGRRHKAKLNISLATFVPKAHTPFMWVPQIDLEESRRRIRFVKDALKNKPIRVKWNDPEMSWLEGIFARGDRRLTKVLLEARRMGAGFDAWREHFRLEIWKEAFKRTGLDPEFYLYRERSMDEVMPWDHIHSGVSKRYLKNEWKKALKQIETPDCREGCLECGVCDHRQIDPVLFRGKGGPLHSEKPLLFHLSPVTKKYRLTFSKTDSARFLSHLELVRLFIRALRRAGLKFVYSKGYHPMPKVSFASALPVGTESIHETADIELYEETSDRLLKETINDRLPPGIRVALIEDVTREGKSPRLKESHFYINMGEIRIEKRELERFMQSENFPILKRGKKGDRRIDARAQVKAMKLISPNDLSLTITHNSGPELRPIEIIKGVFHLKDQYVKEIKILKFKQVLSYG